MPSILVTGASRGIGREFVRQYVSDGWEVLAACRDPSATDQVAGAEYLELDVDDAGSIAACRAALGDRPVDVLVNNAGIIGQRAGFGSLDYTAWQAAMTTNVFGPMRVAEAFVDRVVASSRRQMVFISSYMGSISGAGPGACVYRSSKAALNMAVRCMSLQLVGQGVTAVLFHPGHVSTDMGGASAPVTPEQSVRGMKEQILSLSAADNGRFLSFRGEELPW